MNIEKREKYEKTSLKKNINIITRDVDRYITQAKQLIEQWEKDVDIIAWTISKQLQERIWELFIESNSTDNRILQIEKQRAYTLCMLLRRHHIDKLLYPLSSPSP